MGNYAKNGIFENFARVSPRETSKNTSKSTKIVQTSLVFRCFRPSRYQRRRRIGAARRGDCPPSRLRRWIQTYLQSAQPSEPKCEICVGVLNVFGRIAIVCTSCLSFRISLIFFTSFSQFAWLFASFPNFSYYFHGGRQKWNVSNWNCIRNAQHASHVARDVPTSAIYRCAPPPKPGEPTPSGHGVNYTFLKTSQPPSPTWIFQIH